ncbi:uncharacterized protein LOC114352414 isoform X2 [Ostrinia furnacalis]|uniref:uncharacterized protein LOC114352414 isoform X2 n=1 Tax=Ostrinia furnacalis TaxID=93504 RepID=UPI001038C3FD|nr:uncharacterized protein LOC114352414 isoform X2 [Ostrinia furnacalis]
MSQTPRVWRKFTVKSKDGELKLRIQDMPSDRLDDLNDIFLKYFVTEETSHKAADEDPEVVGEIIGASMTIVVKKDDPEEDMNFTDKKTKTKEVAALFAIIDILFSKYDVMKDLNLDSFLDDRGVVINPKYRGLGIAQMFFNVRRQICHNLGIPLTGAWMTSAGSQKAAARDGWETVFEIPYEEFGKEAGVVFEDVPPSCKFMTAKPLSI